MRKHHIELALLIIAFVLLTIVGMVLVLVIARAGALPRYPV